MKPTPLKGGEFDTSVLDAANILAFDIETVPASGWFWHPKVSYIPWKHITEPGSMLSWAAGWYHQPGQTLFSDRIRKNYDDMLWELWLLLDKASYVVGWNSDRFATSSSVAGTAAGWREGWPTPGRP